MSDANYDVNDLVSDLKKNINGEVRFDNGARALYATDGSNYRQVPIGIVIPKDKESVIETVRLCNKYDVPLLSRGCGTSLAGQCCNTAVIMDFSKYLNNIIELNPNEKYAWVQPGLILDNLRDAAEKYHLTFGPDPSTHTHCTLGGMIGNNSCGVHSVMAGRTADNVEELEILTYDGLQMHVGPTPDDEYKRRISIGGREGEIYAKLRQIRDNYADLIRTRYPKIPRRVSGYNLDNLLPENGFDVAKALVGSESTCIIILEAKTRLIYSPPARSLVVLGYPDVFQAGDHIPEIMSFHPTGCEGLDHILIEFNEKKGMNITNLHFLPEGNGLLLVEFGGETKKDSDDKAKQMMEKLKKGNNPPTMKLFDNKHEEILIWKIRESGLGATAHVPGEPASWPGWEDSAVPPDKVGPYLKDLKNLFDKYHYHASVYGHLGQGCIHCRIPFDLFTAEGIQQYKAFMYEAVELVLRYGGSLSGEHGDGQSRAEFLYMMFGTELIEAFKEFKTIWDPKWKMNPGKVVNPYKIDENLRLGSDYNPPTVKTYFKYPHDSGNFAGATLRCVGVAKCRREGGGTMCPSFMATHEEMHSTRGRARLLFEMMHGDPLKDGWKSGHVHDALDLCLACKGCKSDCPVNVDMAMYKAEFLSHYYKGRIRPRTAYSMGLIYWWAKIGSRIPNLTNFVTHAPVLKSIAKALAGISPERDIPRFAETTFRDWYNHFKRFRKISRKRVILWPDTFNNNFHPETAIAAVHVLEDAGFSVEIPQKVLCCGRPLYDFGMLDRAKQLLVEVMGTLKKDIEDGIAIVGLEPSCITTFRDELINLYPNNEDAKRLSNQTFLLSEFLSQNSDKYNIPQLQRKAVVHAHCHHKSVLGVEAEEDVLKKMGLDFNLLDSGCCGMAGSFGFEKDKYDISVKCGDRVLLPEVKKADQNTIIIADGFSCREQIRQLTDREALHLAEVLYMAIKNEKSIQPEKFYEQIKQELTHEIQ